MPRPTMFSIAPEDKRSVTVNLKLTEQENELLTKYATHLESDKSYVAGKIFEAFIPQAMKPAASVEVDPQKRASGTAKKQTVA